MIIIPLLFHYYYSIIISLLFHYYHLGELGEADGVAEGPGGIRQPCPGGKRIRQGGLSSETLQEGISAEDVFSGNTTTF